MESAVAPTAGSVREPVLSLKGVSKGFGAVRALTDINLDIHAGEVVAIVGDNGAGKSTLVKILAGVHPQDSGTITFDGQVVSIPTPTASRALGIATVFQDLALCDNLDVVSNLFLGREITHGTLDEEEMEQRAWSLLRQLSAKIPSVRIAVASLSGGQRQTVAIARSLIGEPSVVILDEPTAALGVAQTAEVLNLIERLRERGLGVLIISHNMADVQAVADRVVVLRLGRNNGDFHVADVSYEEIISAITGATDNVVTRRASAHAVASAAEAHDAAAPPAGRATPDAVGPTLGKATVEEPLPDNATGADNHDDGSKEIR
ncbi:ABC transporter ATP-binding protein [Subtercola boreus]|uniref:ABC transporter ATP-binding protein n=1 Tax=Subtercola boreus TaxID=120213 RepID=A0A3E0VNK4_9MICO|nr:ABC transporter ATP-binding protein [Subtercola boreus]